MTKYFAKATRAFTREIAMGPMVLNGLATGQTKEVLPPRVAVLETKAGQVLQFRTAKARNDYVAAVNAENPGAVEVAA
jgi:hypothetical protein